MALMPMLKSEHRMKGSGKMSEYPVIDIYKTGQKIRQLMLWRGKAVADVQQYLGLATPQSIYHWFSGRNMPTIDNLYALSALLSVPVDAMICGNRRMNSYFYGISSYNRLLIYYKKIIALKEG